MALPTIEKTYEFDINNQVLGAGGGGTDGTPERKTLLFEIVSAMLNGGTFTVPWTVQGSSDSAAAAMDATNRWVSSANVIWGRNDLADARSWIVIFNTGLGVHLLLECATPFNTEGGAIRAYASTVGFGTANGGTDGSTTVRPTATDECELRNGFANADGGWSAFSDGAARNFRWNVVASDDGEVWTVLIYYANLCVGFWRFERPKNPPVGWGSPAILGMLGTADATQNADTAARSGQSGNGHFACLDGTRRGSNAGQQISGLNASQRTEVRPNTWGWQDDQGNSQLTVVHSITGDPQIWPIWWWTNATAMGPGRLGRPYDMWLRQSTVGGSPGDTHPSNPATPQFIVCGESFIIPWDGVTTPLTT